MVIVKKVKQCWYLEHAVHRVCRNCASTPSRGLVYYSRAGKTHINTQQRDTARLHKALILYDAKGNVHNKFVRRGPTLSGVGVGGGGGLSKTPPIS